MSSVALESELGDCDVEIYGHEHRAENLEQEESVIEELLEDNELLVFEPLGVQHDTPDIGGTPSWESTKDGYVGGVMDMAEDTMDTAYGLDSKNTEFTYAAGLLVPGAATFSLAIKNAVEAVKQSSSVELDRRDFILGSSGVASYGLMGGFDALLPRKVGFPNNELDVPEVPSQSDAREVYVAEGIARLTQDKDTDSILGVFGRKHAHNIKEYLEQPESRAEKLDFYSDIISGNSEKYTRFENTNEGWQLSEVGEIRDI
jgi:hypothetical protein